MKNAAKNAEKLENAPRDPARKPHRVTRTLVMREGDVEAKNLYAWFDYFNREHFAGRLETPSLWIAPTSSPRAEGSYTPRDVSGMLSVIRIRPSTYARGDRHAIACLLHEMIHAYQSEVLKDTEHGKAGGKGKGYKGHGPKFTAEANRIGLVYGFAECAPKGRGDKARAECWPTLPPGPDDVTTAPGEPTEPEPVDVDVDAPDGDEGDDGDRDVDPTMAERERVAQWLGARSVEHLREATKGGTREPKGQAYTRAQLLKWCAFQIAKGVHAK